MISEQTVIVEKRDSGKIRFAEGNRTVAYRHILVAYENYFQELLQTVSTYVDRQGSRQRIFQFFSNKTYTGGASCRSSGEGAHETTPVTQEQSKMTENDVLDKSWKIIPPPIEQLEADMEEVNEDFFDTSSFKAKINARWDNISNDKKKVREKSRKKRASE